MKVSKQIIISIKCHSSNQSQHKVLKKGHCQSYRSEVRLKVFNGPVFLQNFQKICFSLSLNRKLLNPFSLTYIFGKKEGVDCL